MQLVKNKFLIISTYLRLVVTKAVILDEVIGKLSVADKGGGGVVQVAGWKRLRSISANRRSKDGHGEDEEGTNRDQDGHFTNHRQEQAQV